MNEIQGKKHSKGYIFYVTYLVALSVCLLNAVPEQKLMPFGAPWEKMETLGNPSFGTDIILRVTQKVQFRTRSSFLS